MANASMNSIKTRMKSVTGTMQITKAMELVATSKLRRQRERADAARPFFETARGAVASALALDGADQSLYVKASDAPTLYIVIAGDRGLAGGYNSNVFRLEAELSQGEGLVLPVGKKAVEYYRRRGRELLTQGYASAADIGVGDAFSMAKLVLSAFAEGRVGRVVLVYTRFVSMLTQAATSTPLLPLTPTDTAPAAPIVEAEDVDALLSVMLDAYLGGVLYAATTESVAAESGARRTAMNAANKNAEEMLGELSLRFNRARQAVITQEITEIVSGADSL